MIWSVNESWYDEDFEKIVDNTITKWILRRAGVTLSSNERNFR